MTSTSELAILLTGKDQASSVFRGVGSAASSLGSHIGSIASTAAGFAIGMGITQLPGMLMDAAKAAAEDAASVAKLQTAVQNTGASWDTYSSQLSKVVDNGIRLGFADSQTRDALSLLTAQTGSAEEAQRRLALAQDFSRGTGVDLQTAAKLLGKVTDENVNVLGRYGIAVEKGTSQTELFAKIQEKFGGQAEAFAGSTAGMLEAFNLQVGEMQEAIGAAVLPLLTKFAAFLTDVLVPAFNAFVVPAMEATADALGGLLEAIEPVMMALSGLVSFFAGGIDTTELTDALSELFGDTAADMIVGFVEQVRGGFETVKQIVSDALATIRQVFDSDWVSSDEIEPFTRAMGEAAIVMRDVVMPAIGELLGFLQSAWADAVNATQEKWPLISEIVQRIMDIITAIVSTATALIESVVGTHGDTLSGMFSATWEGIKTILDGALTILLGLLKTGLAVLQGDWAGAWEGVQTQLRGAWEILDGITSIGIAGLVRNMIAGGLEAGRSFVQGIGDGLSGLWSALQSAVSDAVSRIRVDAGPFHLSVGGFRIDAPKMPSIHIPEFAAGGVVPGLPGQPLMAVVHGGELVVPNRGGVAVSGGGGGVYNFHFHAPVYGNSDFQDAVVQALSDAGRRGRVNNALLRLTG